MNKSIKILIGGLSVAAIVIVVGLVNTYRLDSKVQQLELTCIEEGKVDKSSEWELVCEAKQLSLDSVGIQLEIAEAQLDAKKSREWPYIFALGILAISVVPFAWYFLLARVRELHDAITGK